jgi:adenine deaminase
VAHDAHNYIAVGVDDHSILTDLEFLVKNKGCLAVAQGGEIKQALSLPIGGLMSTLTATELAPAFKKVTQAAAELCETGEKGTTCAQPFMALGFLSLSVIPELKLTDQRSNRAAAENRPEETKSRLRPPFKINYLEGVS